MGADALGAGVELVTEDEYQVDGDTEVAGDESGGVPAALDEYFETLGQGDEDAHGEGAVRPPNAQRRHVRHLGVREALRLARAHEPDVRHQNRDPRHQAEDGDHVDEVREDGLGVVGDVHEGEQGEDGRGAERVQRDAPVVGAPEDAGRGAVGGEAVKGAAGDVQIGVGGGEDEDEDAGVEDVVEGVDVGQLDGDDKGRRVGAAGRLGGEDELLRVVRHAHAQQEDADAVEEDDSEEGQLDGARHRLARVLRLADRDTDQLRAEVGERGRNHGRPERQEFTRGLVFVDEIRESTKYGREYKPQFA